MQTANSLSITLILALLAALPCLATMPTRGTMVTRAAPVSTMLPAIGRDSGCEAAMAYFDPSFGRSSGAHVLMPLPDRLGRRERTVLMLARADRPASLREPRRLARWLGVAPANRLADPRLEALRRFAVLLHHRGERVAERETARLREAGFTDAQIGQARAFVLRGAASRRARPALRAFLVAALLAPACWGYQRLADWTSDPLISLVLTLVGLSSLAPLATTSAPRQRKAQARNAAPASRRTIAA